MPKKVNNVAKHEELSVSSALDTSMKKGGSVRTVMLICGIIVLGVLFKDDVFGQIMVAVYGLAALLFRIESLTTFKLAVVMFVSVALLALRNNYALAQTFATYAFLLMVIAIVCAFREQYSVRKLTR